MDRTDLQGFFFGGFSTSALPQRVANLMRLHRSSTAPLSGLSRKAESLAARLNAKFFQITRPPTLPPMRTEAPLPALDPLPSGVEAQIHAQAAADRAYARAGAFTTLGLLLIISVPYLILQPRTTGAPSPLTSLNHRPVAHPVSAPIETHKKNPKSA